MMKLRIRIQFLGGKVSKDASLACIVAGRGTEVKPRLDMTQGWLRNVLVESRASPPRLDGETPVPPLPLRGFD